MHPVDLADADVGEGIRGLRKYELATRMRMRAMAPSLTACWVFDVIFLHTHRPGGVPGFHHTRSVLLAHQPAHTTPTPASTAAAQRGRSGVPLTLTLVPGAW